MNVHERDMLLLRKIVDYCREIEEIIAMHDADKAKFVSNISCRYACAMCVMQIGELSTRLSDEIKMKISIIPWNVVRGRRNSLEHDYMKTDWSVIWETIQQDIPVLKLACERYITISSSTA